MRMRAPAAARLGRNKAITYLSILDGEYGMRRVNSIQASKVD